MFSLHCEQESNRTNVFYMHALKVTNISPTAGFLFSSVPPGSHVFHPWWQGQPVSAWNNWQFFSQSVVRPINYWKSHPYQPSAVAQSLKICPITRAQRKTPGMPGSPVSHRLGRVAGPLDCEPVVPSLWEAESLICPYLFSYTTIYSVHNSLRQCDSSVVSSDFCPNSLWCPFSYESNS